MGPSYPQGTSCNSDHCLGLGKSISVPCLGLRDPSYSLVLQQFREQIPAKKYRKKWVKNHLESTRQGKKEMGKSCSAQCVQMKWERSTGTAQSRWTQRSNLPLMQENVNSPVPEWFLSLAKPKETVCRGIPHVPGYQNGNGSLTLPEDNIRSPFLPQFLST